MKKFTDALLGTAKKKHHHHHTHEEKDGPTSEKKHHHKSKEGKHHHKHAKKVKDVQAPTTPSLVVAAEPTVIAAKPDIVAAPVTNEMPKTPSGPSTQIGSPLVEQHSIVELLHETNPMVASHAHDIIQKRQSAELIFSGVGTDAHGLHGRLAPPHSMTLTPAGIHYLTTDEAVLAMDRKQGEKHVQSRENMLENSEDEPIGKKPPQRESKKEEEAPLGKVVKRNRI
ncbi:MAG: hypothetical protein AB7I18_12670 [Candidatus Berkiella sp.]